ncbi:hypothetical protein [Nesterenkonia flava]|uniref:Uncharacterized protein n=1 Tax=Nesterenkonia flava TaxID=469799 RepID=A0ABU1FUR7_9MICC|nr:hypothetical protein [Nesterenkonia flava]MDR5712245.1 hypothetical protein [Nesterenkonia flava]
MLASSYARPVVARMLSGISPQMSIRATAAGWTLTAPGRALAVAQSGADLLERVAVTLQRQGTGAGQVTKALAGVSAHRPLELRREAFPASRVGNAERGSPAVSADQVIPAFLGTSLAAALAGDTAPAVVVLESPAGLWSLDVHLEGGFASLKA